MKKLITSDQHQTEKKIVSKLKGMREVILPGCVGETAPLTADIREVSLYLLKTLVHDDGYPRYRADAEDEFRFPLEIGDPSHIVAWSRIVSLLSEFVHFQFWQVCTIQAYQLLRSAQHGLEIHLDVQCKN
jgi:hypothetical protein